MAPPLTDRLVVLDAARRVVMAHGLAGARVDHIAEEARVSRATVYRIVGGRDQLVQALLLDEALPLFERVSQAIRGADTGFGIIEAGVDAALTVIAERPLLRRLATNDLDLILADLTTHAQALIAEVVAILAPILEEACARGALPAETDPEFLAEELIRYVIGLLHTPTLQGNGRDPAVAGDRARRTFALWSAIALSERASAGPRAD